MKNRKVTICEVLMERLVNLAALECSTQFQAVYLDTLHTAEAQRTHLRRSGTAARPVRPAAACVPGCRIQNA